MLVMVEGLTSSPPAGLQRLHGRCGWLERQSGLALGFVWVCGRDEQRPRTRQNVASTRFETGI